MVVLIEKDSPCFEKDKARELFELNRQNLDDENGFEGILANSRFFNVYQQGYIGSAFVYQGKDDNKNYLGGYMVRKHHKEAVEAIRQIAAMFDELYAHTRHLNAVIALKRAGFKWYSRKNQLLRKSTVKEKQKCLVK